MKDFIFAIFHGDIKQQQIAISEMKPLQQLEIQHKGATLSLKSS